MPATPRIPYEQLPLTLQNQLRPRVQRLGYLGEFFQVAAHQPEALGHFAAFTEALKEALDWRLVETIALTVAAETGNAYERVQHERLALRLGMSEQEVRALVMEGQDAASLPADRERSASEIAAASLARQVVHSRGRSCRGAFDQLTEVAGHKVAVGCLMTAVRYLAHATMANTWGLRPPVPSPLSPASPDA